MLRLRRYSSTSYSVESVLKHVRNKKPIQDKEIEDYSGVRMLLPPPNVTGKLHLGHGLTITIQDTLNRLSRLRGEKPIWFPGLDHAGISVQSVVEKELWKGSNLKRIHLSREHFVGECNKWKDLKTEQISSQIKKMGAAIDWSHQYYTMDDTFSSGVGKAFVQLHQDGYIFRDKRMINWCPTLQSSISDQEVSTISVTAGDSITIPSNGIKRNVKFGRLFKVKYELADCSFQKFVQVETSRPETIFADVALAVNPSDDRYTKLIGLDVINPLTGKRMKIVTNEEVKIEFGTGVLKLTPNHSQIDFKIVTKCIEEGVLSKDLMSINCIDEQGKMVITSNHSSLNGLDRFEAREQVINLLSSQDKLIESTKQGYKTEIPVCERSGDVIEPVLKEQWFMRTASLHQQIKEHLKKGNLRIFPEFHKENLNQWLNNEDPWCLSRQLWWGHQIPAYFDADSNKWIVTDQENKVNKRDEDVLDTWFSSGLIPAILGGWPTNKKPLQMSFLETGHDILGFWVSYRLY
uniref:Valine--tRNA ligase n=1 Tax=Rhabditophanes sp. KR3021 TaxID=114890 RepID=A0AC35UHV4_9BILA